MGDMRPPGPKLGRAALYACVVLGFGSAFSLNSVSVDLVHPLWVAASRSLIALAALGTWLVLSRIPTRLDRRAIVLAIVLGVLSGVVPYFLLGWGQQYVASSIAGIVFAGVPLLTILFGALFFGQGRPSLLALGGSLLGLSGVALALPLVKEPQAEPLLVLGGLAIVGAATSYAFGSLVFQTRWRRHPLPLTVLQLVPATVVLVALAWPVVGPPAASLPAEALLRLFGLGLFGTAVPVAAMFALIGSEGAVAAARTTFFIPFVAVVIGVAALDESLPVNVVFGFVLAVLGYIFVRRK